MRRVLGSNSLLLKMDINNRQIDFCLLIPCYNNLQGLIESLKSVCYPSDRFLAVIVDDGSQVTVTSEAIRPHVSADYPFMILRSNLNKGIAPALNKGLKWIAENAPSRYIARLDCADRCDATRFVKQVEYLDTHPNTILLGSWCIFEDRQTSVRYKYRTPVRHSAIRRAMYLKNVFIHPTVMLRTSALNSIGYYPDNFLHAEDYALFWQLLKIGRGEILDEFLVNCEMNKDGISAKNRRKQLAVRRKVIQYYGTNFFLKIIGILRLEFLRILPKPLILRLKKLTTW